jgi:AraC-like DNA-binding protein
MDSHLIHPNHPVLNKSVISMWQLSGFPSYRHERIIPKGIIEVIFNFTESDSITASIRNQCMQLPRCFIWGVTTHPIELNLPYHHSFFGVRFKVDAIRQLFAAPAGMFTHEPVDMTLVDKTISELWDKLAGEQDFNKRVSFVIQWLSKKSFEPHIRERSLADFLDDDLCGNYTARALSEKMFYSSRQLSRKFQETTGMNTEEILQYKKYLQALAMMHKTEFSLSEIAHHCHFFDQSHFIRVFKSYAEITPGSYRQRMSFLQGHIFE